MFKCKTLTADILHLGVGFRWFASDYGVVGDISCDNSPCPYIYAASYNYIANDESSGSNIYIVANDWRWALIPVR